MAMPAAGGGGGHHPKANDLALTCCFGLTAQSPRLPPCWVNCLEFLSLKRFPHLWASYCPCLPFSPKLPGNRKPPSQWAPSHLEGAIITL
jgi:hypothetical protein